MYFLGSLFRLSPSLSLWTDMSQCLRWSTTCALSKCSCFSLFLLKNASIWHMKKWEIVKMNLMTHFSVSLHLSLFWQTFPIVKGGRKSVLCLNVHAFHNFCCLCNQPRSISCVQWTVRAPHTLTVWCTCPWMTTGRREARRPARRPVAGLEALWPPHCVLAAPAL